MDNAKKVQTLLKWTFGLVVIVAGIDKFTNILVDWSVYVSPFVDNIISAGTLMPIVGIIEIIAGLLVLFMTRFGAYLVSVWLLLIAGNLVMLGLYDIAVRDIVLAISAFSLGQLSSK